MRPTFLAMLFVMACGGGGSDDTVDGVAVGDDDDDDDDIPATHSTVPWSQVEPTQPECCGRITENFEWVEDRIEDGVKYNYVMPNDPIGAVIILHGSNSGLSAVQQPEWLELYNLLEPRGIGIMMTVSTDQDKKQWDNFTANVDNLDVDRIEDMMALVADATDFEINDPIVTVGFSNGAKFSEVLSGALYERGRDVRGAVMHNGGSGGVDASLPALWLSAENDTSGGGPAVMAGQASAQGSGSLHLAGTEVPVHPNVFAKMSSYNQEESALLFDTMVDMGWLDEDGVRAFEFEGDPDDHCDALENQLSVAYPTDVVYHLRIAWAVHRMSAQNKIPEAQWIEEQLLR